ncbi:unnamed protein product [Alopecurus aequalis]
MYKRRRSSDHHRDGGAKRPRHGQKQLYVVLDDWEKGYSIHKIDGDAFEDSRYGAEELELADPPVVRLEESCKGVLIGALGSKILALWQPTAANRAVAYDTKTAALAVGPPHPDALQNMRFVVAVGKKLCAMHEGGMHCLDMEAEEHQWAWTRVSSSTLPLPGCEDDPDVPIEITAYAVHPDGRTVFVSAHAKDRRPRSAYAGTFSLDTGADGDVEWKLRGEWLLPFQGQGHYDADLDAWVGLHSPRHMCTCNVPAPLDDDTPAPAKPTWKLLRTAQFSADPDPRRGDSAASLVSMGDGEFCVVESLLAKDEYVQLRLTKFRLRRDRHGQLTASSRRGGALSCRVRKFDSLFSPRAFCM